MPIIVIPPVRSKVRHHSLRCFSGFSSLPRTANLVCNSRLDKELVLPDFTKTSLKNCSIKKLVYLQLFQIYHAFMKILHMLNTLITLLISNPKWYLDVLGICISHNHFFTQVWSPPNMSLIFGWSQSKTQTSFF